MYNANTNYRQYYFGNALFSPLPITNFSDTMHNLTDSYTYAGSYMLSVTAGINALNLYPQSGKLTRVITPHTLFRNNSNRDKDFNGDSYNRSYLGANSGCCVKNVWQLQLDIMQMQQAATGIISLTDEVSLEVYPNPVSSVLQVNYPDTASSQMEVYNVSGEMIFSAPLSATLTEIDFTDQPAGVYQIRIISRTFIVSKKIIKL